MFTHQIKCCWNLNTRTILRILFTLLCVKHVFLWFYRSVRLKGNHKYAKKRITSAMTYIDVATFTFTAWQTRSCLLCKFFMLKETVVSSFAFLRVFLVGLCDWSAFFRCLIERVNDGHWSHEFSREKKPALVKYPFFTAISSRNICKFIFVWQVTEMTFSVYHAKPTVTLCKECNQKRWLQSDYRIYHFCVNSYHTLAKIKSVPYQSSLIMFLKVRL